MKKTLFLLLALPGMVHAEAQTATAVSGTPFYAATTTATGDVDVNVTAGTTGSTWAAAFGGTPSQTLTGDVSLSFSGEYTGSATVFGAVNTGSVTGDVTLVFDAENASYASFTDVGNANNQSVSLVGAYQANINGSFNVVINKGVFQYDILGGVHTGSNTIGSTHITINGGTIADDVYAGGRIGTITGNTAITITNLAALSSHTATNIISAGGKGGTIDGDSSVTFSGVNGTYAGTVSGGTNVAGASTLVVDNNSTLVLGNVTDFDSFTVEEGSTLTVNGNITTDATLSISYDAATVATKKDNGLGVGTLVGLVTGEGTFNLGEGATINAMTVDGTNGKDFIINNAIYYVMDSVVLEAPKYPVDPREGNVYSLGNGKEILESSVVNVGVHERSAPIATEGANEAMGYYVGGDGTLCIMGDVSETKTAGQILESVQGDGNVILRTAGYENPDGTLPQLHVSVDSKINVTGELYLAPYWVGSQQGAMNFQPGVVLELEEGADISSFSGVYMCYPESIIALNGTLGRSSESVGHINDLQAYGSSSTYLYVNKNANDHLVLGGDTVIQPYEHGAGTLAGSNFFIVANKDNSVINIEHLVGTETQATLNFQSLMDDVYEKDTVVNSTLVIESFDFRGMILFPGSQLMEGSLHIDVNLLDGQWITSDQYKSFDYKRAHQIPSLTLKGTGTYVLAENKDILINIGRLSEEYDEQGSRIWRGTVQMTNVDGTGSTNGTGRGIDFSYYGNEASYVDMRGFKGEVVAWAADGTVKADQPASVDIAPNLILTNTDKMVAYEVTGGIETQNYQGDISGEGDIVISAAESKNINLEGSINSWSGDLTVTNGTHQVQLANDAEAVAVNGTFSDAGDGALNVIVDTAKGTTFHKAFDVNSLTVNSGAVATVTETSSAGNVQISRRVDTAAATVADGMVIGANSISGGMAEQATLAFTTDADNSVSAATLQSVTLTSVTGSRVTMADIEASDVYLMGLGVDFYSIVTQTQFTVTEAAVEGGKAFNEVRFESDIFDGMTLANDGATATIGVSNEVDWAAFGVNDALSNVTIMLTGFTLEGYNSGEGWPTENLIFDTGLSKGVADSGVSALLNLDLQKYDVVTYNQTAAGLEIRMEHLPSPTIPEPTTATLSLLALAALAARRRRR